MVDAMVAELASVSELLEAQVKAGKDRADVLESLSRSWIARLNNQPKLSTTDKMKLTDAITACPWTEEQRKSLAQIVLANGSKDSSASRNLKTTQKCHNFENFIQTHIVLKLKARATTKVQANGEWILQDSAKFSVVSRLSFIATAARQVGIVGRVYSV